MATPTWITLANSNQYNQANAGTAVSNFTTATDVSPGTNVTGQAFQTSPAQLYPGQMWRFTANGIWSSTASPGVSLGIYYGGAAGSPICYASVGPGSAQANAASIPWYLTAMGKLTAVGASVGSWQVIGTLTGLYNPSGTGAALGGYGTSLMPVYTSAAQYDTSTARLITLAATCSAASTSNAMTVYNWAIEYMTEP